MVRESHLNDTKLRIKLLIIVRSKCVEERFIQMVLIRFAKDIFWHV